MSSPPSFQEKCLFCKQHGENDDGWVECQHCGWRCHALCAGVVPDVNVGWFCPLCVPSNPLLLKVPEERTKKSGAVSDSGTIPGASSSTVLTEKQLAAEQRAQEKAFLKQMELRRKRLAEKLAWADRRLKEEAEMQELELKAQRDMEQKQLVNDQKMLDRQLASEKEFLKKRAALQKQIEASKAKVTALKSVKIRPEGAVEESSEEEDDESEKFGNGKSLSKKNKRDGPGSGVIRITREQMAARKVVSQALPKFRGEPEVWPLFISSFEHTTAACGFSNLENLTRLMDSLEGDALENVRSRLVYPDAVPDIIQDLRDMFGRPEKLMKTLLMKVRNAPAPRADRLNTFITFGIIVKQLCDHLEAAKMSDHLNNPMLVQELIEKLPPSYKLEWVRFKRGKVNSPLRMFTNFISALVSDVSEVADFTELTQVDSLARKDLFKWQDGDESGGDDLHQAKESVQWKEVRLNAQQDGDKSVLFRMVPVTLYAGSERIDTLAFLDEGSSNTLIEESVANRLKLRGEVEPLVMSWTNDVKRHEKGSRKVRLALSAKRWNKRYGLQNVHTVENLGLPEQSLEFEWMAERYPWMADLRPEDYELQRPTILIGLDNLHLFAPLDSRIGKPGEPIAVQTLLGWTVYGRFNREYGANAVVNLHCSGRALGTSGGVAGRRQTSANRCGDPVEVSQQSTEGRIGESQGEVRKKCDIARKVRVNVHVAKSNDGEIRHIEEWSRERNGGCWIVVGKAKHEKKKRKSGLTRSVARTPGHEISTRNLWSTLALEDTGAPENMEADARIENEVQRNRKQPRNQSTFLVGRTVWTEERGRHNEGFVVKDGSRKTTETDSLVSGAESDATTRRTLDGRSMSGDGTSYHRRSLNADDSSAAGIRE